MSYTYTNRIVFRATSLREVLAGEQGFLLNLEDASLDTVALVLFCAMSNGMREKGGLLDYLLLQGAPIDEGVLSFLLDVFEGEDPAYHLWIKDEEGEYEPLTAAIPDWGHW